MSKFVHPSDGMGPGFSTEQRSREEPEDERIESIDGNKASSKKRGRDVSSSEEENASVGLVVVPVATEGKVIIRCSCDNTEQHDGFMVQCEGCQAWVHAACYNIIESNVPDVFVCAACAMCSVCHEPMPRIELKSATSNRCTHMACRDCLQHHIEAEVNSKGQTLDVFCIAGKVRCGVQLTFEEIRENASARVFDRYDTLLTRRMLQGIVESSLFFDLG